MSGPSRVPLSPRARSRAAEGPVPSARGDPAALVPPRSPGVRGPRGAAEGSASVGAARRLRVRQAAPRGPGGGAEGAAVPMGSRGRHRRCPGPARFQPRFSVCSREAPSSWRARHRHSPGSPRPQRESARSPGGTPAPRRPQQKRQRPSRGGSTQLQQQMPAGPGPESPGPDPGPGPT